MKLLNKGTLVTATVRRNGIIKNYEPGKVVNVDTQNDGTLFPYLVRFNSDGAEVWVKDTELVEAPDEPQNLPGCMIILLISSLLGLAVLLYH